MVKFVMTQAICPEGIEKLKADTNNDVNIYVADNQDPNNYLDEMQDADALIVRIVKCDAHAIENSPNLKVIGRTGIGYDSVDVKKATELGIPVVITPGANNRSVAEHALTLMLALSKNIVEGQNEMVKGNWQIRDAKKAFEFEEKRVAIVGLGKIGAIVAKLCAGVGMHVVGYDPFFTKEQVEGMGYEYAATLEEALRTCDIINIQMPLVDATRNMITAKELNMMKKTAIIINCGRGEIINEPDLCAALKAGTIAGAGLDVFWHEPPHPDDEILTCPNVIISPHSAAQTREAVIKMANMCVDGCLAVLRGEKWPYVADPKVYEHPRWSGK